ncbi:GAF domain-containing protein [Paractinoplanes globisporus]|uniref:histidine kinase n=1 Tax=Paractinoplanes globisporus TaxID=113565 RepID=A0ABW6WK89_9ACTN|nr:GAF domain-containing protein [Actinoplanes globisporus]
MIHPGRRGPADRTADAPPAGEPPGTGERPLVDQLAALRRLGELVARGIDRAAVFDAIVAEAYAAFQVDFTALLRYEPDGVAHIVALRNGPPGLEVGERAPHLPDGLVLRVFDSGRPVRVDYADVPRDEAARLHELGITAGVAAPILVEGHLWGVLTGMSLSGTVAAGLEHRIADFADIAATAVAGAHAKDDFRVLADEQAALRRVAELAARGTEPDDVFRALAVEVSALRNGCRTLIARFDHGGTATVLAVSGERGRAAGSVRFTGDDLGAVVQRHGRAARIDDYSSAPVSEATTEARASGIRASVGVPITVAGEIWGLLAMTSNDRPLPPDTERCLSQFAEIAAIAMLSAKSRADLRRLAAEQAALRRVAELVARGTGGQRLFDAVTGEAAALTGNEASTLARLTGERTITVVATHGGPAPVGYTVEIPLDDGGPVAEMLRTGRSARLDDYGAKTGPLLGHTEFGVGSSVFVPIVVEDRMWGMIGVTTPGRRLPADTEQRLDQFAELVAAALANNQARAKVEQMAGQQAALRQVAELAAANASAEQVLESVAVQASYLAGVSFTTVLRYEPDGSTEIVALSGAPGDLVPGMRAPGTGDGAVQRVWRTGRSARIDNLAGMSGRWPHVAHGFGFSASAAVPIRLQGQLWGVLVAVGRDRPISETVLDDLTSFAELAGTTISAAQARDEVRALAQEQAAFRRVAELVAHGTALGELFEAITTEASKLLGGSPAVLRPFDADRSAVAPGEVSVPVTVEGQIWGTLTAQIPEPPVAGTTERLRQFADLAALAIANAENKAQLTASRARVVATADETRRRLQRDVHDGAQQRLVQAIITLKLTRDSLTRGRAVGDQIDEALYHAERANNDLRDVVHGILPAALTQGGLRTGLESLIGDMSLPVRLGLDTPALPTEIETTAYFIVAEALTNVIKHARATQAEVRVRLDGANLSIEISDDGVGGADPAGGTGLTGLSDRVGAAGGTLGITSTAGSGTAVHASLPIPRPG